MTWALLTVLLLAQDPAASGTPASAEAELRTVSVTVTDDKGAPLQGLTRDEVGLLENGVGREIESLEPDTRPLTVAFVLDTSEAVRNSFRLQLIEPVLEFLRGLPEGARFAVWTTGDRPEKRVDFTDDVKVVSDSLRRVAPQGGSTLLDTLVDVAKDLRKKEGERSAVVVLTAVGPEFSNRHKERVADEALAPETAFFGLILEEGQTDLENRSGYDFVLESLTKKTGGVLGTSLTAMGTGHELRKILAAIKSQYRLTYATLPTAKTRKLELTVARPNVKVRLPAPPSGKRS
jgi:VWFA-related protein